MALGFLVYMAVVYISSMLKYNISILTILNTRF